MAGRARPPHAGLMNTTAPNSQSNIDAEPADATASDHTLGGAASDLAGGLTTLRRPVEGRMLGGVAAGIAKYLGADVTIVRLVFVLLAFVGGAALPVYVAGWLLIPEEGSDQSIAGDLLSSLENRSR
jgi:phage shock protein PspC (stress-responsive transcriptional regulator)